MSPNPNVATAINGLQPQARPACSIITPVYNGETHLRESLISISKTTAPLSSIQLIIYNDSSTDQSASIITSLRPNLPQNTKLIHASDGPLGVGSARNRACDHADAEILIFHDADDVMRPSRVSRTLAAFLDSDVHIVGGVFDRIPKGSTPRYEAYHQRLSTEQLFVHAFRDAPLAFPTVACRRSVWRDIRFRDGRNVPEDLHFLYDAMEKGYTLRKLDQPSITGYRYHSEMTSASLHRRLLLQVRVTAFEKIMLIRPNWCDGFSIWGCGRDGKDVFKCLSDGAKTLVKAWGDVDEKKIGNIVYGSPVLHFSQLKPPILCAVAMDRGGGFETNLASLQLTPGEDYVHVV